MRKQNVYLGYSEPKLESTCVCVAEVTVFSVQSVFLKSIAACRWSDSQHRLACFECERDAAALCVKKQENAAWISISMGIPPTDKVERIWLWSNGKNNGLVQWFSNGGTWRHSRGYVRSGMGYDRAHHPPPPPPPAGRRSGVGYDRAHPPLYPLSCTNIFDGICGGGGVQTTFFQGWGGCVSILLYYGDAHGYCAYLHLHTACANLILWTAQP